MVLQTLGYEGLSIEEFLALLTSRRVDTLIDVRELPLSRKRGFSKAALASSLATLGIRYVHARALGCPKAIRHEYRRTKDWARYSQQYRAHLATQQEAMESLLTLAQQGNCCVMCFEADAARCHRWFVAGKIAEESGGDVAVRHLRVSPGPSAAALPVPALAWADR